MRNLAGRAIVVERLGKRDVCAAKGDVDVPKAATETEGEAAEQMRIRSNGCQASSRTDGFQWLSRFAISFAVVGVYSLVWVFRKVSNGLMADTGTPRDYSADVSMA